MVRSRDNDCINRISHLPNQFAKISKALCIWKSLHRTCQILLIDVAHRGHFDARVGRDGLKIGPSHAANTDVSRTQLAVGRHCATSASK